MAKTESFLKVIGELTHAKEMDSPHALSLSLSILEELKNKATSLLVIHPITISNNLFHPKIYQKNKIAINSVARLTDFEITILVLI